MNSFEVLQKVGEERTTQVSLQHLVRWKCFLWYQCDFLTVFVVSRDSRQRSGLRGLKNLRGLHLFLKVPLHLCSIPEVKQKPSSLRAIRYDTFKTASVVLFISRCSSPFVVKCSWFCSAAFVMICLIFQGTIKTVWMYHRSLKATAGMWLGFQKILHQSTLK